MDRPEQAKLCLAEACEGWTPRHAFERAVTAGSTSEIQLDLGQLDTAEQFAASAVHTYGEGHRRGRTRTELALAELLMSSST